jgi:hypothetical protein
MLLPFRPSSDTVTARTFIRNYFNESLKRGSPFAGDELAHELRLTDPMVRYSFHLPGILRITILTWRALFEHLLGLMQCYEMVLEQAPRRGCHLGGL